LPEPIRHPLSAVFFDLDGTLVDSRAGVVQAVGEGIRDCFNAHAVELSPPSQERIIAGLGMPAGLYFRSLLPAEFHHLAADAQARSTELEISALAKGHGSLFDGTLDALGRLREAGLSIGIVSNAQKGYFDAALKYFGLGALADFHLCHDDLPVGERAAGKQALLGRALAALEIAGRLAAMVGDRGDDMSAARSHGCRGFGVRCGFGDAQELEAAERSFDDVHAFVGWLLAN
jgi:phosphoglycolate phosphatase